MSPNSKTFSFLSILGPTNSSSLLSSRCIFNPHNLHGYPKTRGNGLWLLTLVQGSFSDVFFIFLFFYPRTASPVLELILTQSLLRCHRQSSPAISIAAVTAIRRARQTSSLSRTTCHSHRLLPVLGPRCSLQSTIALFTFLLVSLPFLFFLCTLSPQIHNPKIALYPVSALAKSTQPTRK